MAALRPDRSDGFGSDARRRLPVSQLTEVREIAEIFTGEAEKRRLCFSAPPVLFRSLCTLRCLDTAQAIDERLDCRPVRVGVCRRLVVVIAAADAHELLRLADRFEQ